MAMVHSPWKRYLICWGVIWSLQATFCGFPARVRLRQTLAPFRTSKYPKVSRAAGNRMLHAMLHVQNIDDSLKFYQNLGMKVLSCNRRSNGAATAFIGFGELRDMASFALELSAPQPKVDQANLARKGISIGSFKGITVSQPAELGGGQLDPDGYPIGILPQTQASIVALCLETSDLDSSISFYTQKL